MTAVEEPLDARALEQLSDFALRRTLAIASGLLAQRMGSPDAQKILLRIADRLPGAPKLEQAT